jgi:hypothetical protein
MKERKWFSYNIRNDISFIRLEGMFFNIANTVGN